MRDTLYLTTLLSFFIYLISPVQLRAETIKLVGDEWCPFNCAADSKLEGILVEIAREALESQGDKIDYSVVPWTRAIEDARKGVYNGIIGAYKSDAPDFIFPDNALVRSVQEFFVLTKSDWKFNGLKSLERKSLGVVADYSYGDQIDPYLKQNRDDPSRVQAVGGEDALAKNIKKLLAGRIDVVLDEASVVTYYLSNNNLLGQIKAAGALDNNEIFIGFSPSDPKSKLRAAQLSRTVEKLNTSGEMEKLLKKYGL